MKKKGFLQAIQETLGKELGEIIDWAPKFLRGLQLGWALLILAVVVGNLVYWLFYIGRPTPLANEEERFEVPEVLVSPETRQIGNTWNQKTWLTQIEALALREEANAVNLAYVTTKGAVYYSPDSGVVFEEDWTMFDRASFPRINSMTPYGTGITLNANGNIYNLNMLQPFVLEAYPEYVFIVDPSGDLWSKAVEDVTFVALSDAQASLPIEIAPNSQLSPTY